MRTAARSIVSFVFLLLPVLLGGACSAPDAAAPPPGPGPADPCSVVLLENNALAYPASARRIGPSGALEEVAAGPGGGPALTHIEPGTWIYFGPTSRGTVKSIVQRGVATALPSGGFGAAFEIEPATHPADVVWSTNRMASKARFTFSLLEQGQPCEEPVRFAASRVGRAAAAGAAAIPATEGIIKGGKGSVYIDGPGIWWITAEKTTDDGKSMLASLTFSVAAGPGPDDYAAFTAGGDFLAGPDEIAERLADAEVIFLGEKHNDPVAHHLEKEILVAVHRNKGRIALSLEMFERDVQPILDAYLAGHYKESHFLKASRPWPAYETDYRPMVEYAREHGLPVVAANSPRRMTNFVTRFGPEGLADLAEAELRWLPPLPYHIPTEGRYVEKLRELFTRMVRSGSEKERKELPGPRTKRDWIAKGNPSLEVYNEALTAAKESPASGGMPGKMPPHGMLKGNSGGYPSQSLWDATMAYSISSFLDAEPGTTVVHVNGSFHTDEHLGTVEQLLRYRPDTKVAVVSMLPDDAFPAFDMEELAKLGDVIIVTNPAWQSEE